MFFYRSRLVSTMLLMFCLTVILPISLITSSIRVYAASSSIKVESQTDTVHYPDYIDFNLRAIDSSSTITKAFIHLDFNDRGFQEQYVVSPPNPASRVQLKWHHTTTGNGFYPQGTPVKYYWVIDDSAGNTFTSDTQSFVTVDTRFNWQSLTSGFVQVHWYQRDQTFGQFILNQTVNHITRIQKKLGTSLDHTINIWIYSSVDDFKGSLDPGAYEWVGGEARPGLNEAEFVVVDSSDERLVRDMPHELTHLVFHQIIKYGINAPTWFDEGLAVENQLFHEQTMTLHFQEALQRHTLFRLSEIDAGFPQDAYKADLAYAQSWQLVNYMYKTFGQAKMTALIKSMGSISTDFNQDLQKTLGVDQDHLENQWRLSLHQSSILTAADQTSTDQPTPAPVPTPQLSTTDNTSTILTIAGSALLLISVTLLIVIVVVRQRQHQNARNVLAAQQNATNPPYTYPPPGGYRPSVIPNNGNPYQPMGKPIPVSEAPYPQTGEPNQRLPETPGSPMAAPTWNETPGSYPHPGNMHAPQD